MLAEETGGIAVVNQNDFDKALKKIDNATSDYYFTVEEQADLVAFLSAL